MFADGSGILLNNRKSTRKIDSRKIGGQNKSSLHFLNWLFTWDMIVGGLSFLIEQSVLKINKVDNWAGYINILFQHFNLYI